MMLPFKYRLKWIHLKSDLSDAWTASRDRIRTAGRIILAAIVLLAIAGVLLGCGLLSYLPAGAPPADLPASTPSPVSIKDGAAQIPMPTSAAIPSPSPTPVDPWEQFPAPVEPSAVEIRRPMRPAARNDQTVNVMVLGSDQRPNDYGHRTDVMLLVSIDRQTKTVKLLSFPRDLYVYIPGWRVDRINVADAKGGPDMVRDTILYNFGLPVDHWIRVDFSGFVRIVDTLGGIDVEVGEAIRDECGRVWSYSPGEYHMNGFQALCYARMRKASGDFDRLRREQEIVLALFNKILSIDGLTHVPELYRQYRGFVETDLELDQVAQFLPAAVDVAGDPSSIERYDIGADMGSLWRVPVSGASVVLPDWDKIERLLVDAFSLPAQS